jgi:hypothetical protein
MTDHPISDYARALVRSELDRTGCPQHSAAKLAGVSRATIAGFIGGYDDQRNPSIGWLDRLIVGLRELPTKHRRTGAPAHRRRRTGPMPEGDER